MPVTKIGDHVIEDGYFNDQGGALEEYWAWCHTCDPVGDDLMLAELDPLSSHGHVILVALMVSEHTGVDLGKLGKAETDDD